jgi:hypothetical protein
VILDQDQIEALFAGETIDHHEKWRPHHTVHLDDGKTLTRPPWTIGQHYAAQIAAGKVASCRVVVLSTVGDHVNKLWTLRLRRLVVEQEKPRLLARGSGKEIKVHPESSRAKGYTDRPSEALRGEPEAIDAPTLEKYSQEARERHTAFIAELESRPLEEQVASALKYAAEIGVDDTHTRAAIQRRLRALYRRIDQRKAA